MAKKGEVQKLAGWWKSNKELVDPPEREERGDLLRHAEVPDVAVFAAANVIADIWKGLGLIIVAGLMRERHRSVAALLYSPSRSRDWRI
jgi:hypothetical protein